MKLWLLTPLKGKYSPRWDYYDSMVVAAKTEDEARKITPRQRNWYDDWIRHSWAESPNDVFVKLIGEAVEGTPAGPILASFNAG